MADCASLISRRFPDTEMIKAEPVAKGALVPPSGAWSPPLDVFSDLPALCRVAGIIRPTADSAIGFELWLPERWNGRYLQTGNGGFAGVINYLGLVAGLRNGFAVASTDAGHGGETTSLGSPYRESERQYHADWAMGHSEKVIDFGYRAVHLTSVVAKQIVNAHYERNFSTAYFSGCSNGGREGLMEAQRYPDDFDGWVLGAPANDFTGVMTYMLSIAQGMSSLEEPIALSQIDALSQAALDHCDASDGVKDGVIEEPLRCSFDPADLQCSGPTDGRCLSKRQVTALQRIYDDAKDGQSGIALTPGLRGARGNETGDWEHWLRSSARSDPPATVMERLSSTFWPFMIYNSPQLDFKTLNLLQAAKQARSQVGVALNSVDPNLSALRASGKKIIQFHGWADSIVPAQYSIAYYEAVESYLRRDNRDFYRLFMVPGMRHCGRGPGPNSFGTPYDARYVGFDPESHVLAALVQWVEKGAAPDRIVATKYEDDDPAKPVIRRRPLCVYPQVAQWNRARNNDDAANFVCAAPKAVSLDPSVLSLR